MELISVLSKETANSFDTISQMEFHLVLGMFNSLKKIAEEQNKEQEKAQSSQSANMPSMPSMSSMMSSAKAMTPKI